LAPASTENNGDAKPILALIKVPPGLEAATAALFDDELAAPLFGLNRDGAQGWVELPPLAAGLPEGARPLAAEIGAPPALARRLGQAGLVASEAEGWRLQPMLAAGQCLVDRDGRLWRWDGFARLAPGEGGAAEQLRQRNRLAVIVDQIAAAETGWRHSEAASAAAQTRSQDAAAAEREAAASLRRTEEALARRRAEEAELTGKALGAETRLAALADSAEKLAAEISEIATQQTETERGLAMAPDLALARAGLDGARAQAAAARRHESEARTAIGRLIQEAEARRHRLGLIATDTESWQRRRERALAQRQVLSERQQALAEELIELAARPAAINVQVEALAETAAKAAAEHRAAADALAVGETRLRDTSELARNAEHDLSTAREERARCEVRRDGAAAMLARLRDEIRERLETLPEALAELAEEGDSGPPDPAALEMRLERLLREREAIGPVNLVAETEAEEVAARVEGLQSEHAELTEAIARLRRGISALDQEGRKRLLGAFDTLNAHFSDLFVRLFGGGRAHLALTEHDDPLEAGLEIMASPPGKRLQALSLLSGGEQALTAIALIFAVFLTNPAPICVLDEVDAPLDDANVDRFCRLIAETADTTGTRFLLVTHHRITMAHMDRLFGVTMSERGVSQLVSVDLARAAELRQTA
jgi:chromosome segregation protein